jgi:hypothetical protein
VNPAGDPHPGTPAAPNATQAAEDQQRRKEFVRRAAKRCNCVGFTFGRGRWEIDTAEVPTILRDNYTRVVERPARVCCIIAYGVDGGTYDHVGLVVEVDANGTPTKIRSKASTSPFIYDHPPDVAPYGNDYQIFERNQVPAAAQADVAAAQAAYDAIPDKASRAAHDAAETLCQKKNALVGA